MTALWIALLVAAVWVILGALLSVGAEADRREAERRRKENE